MLIKRRPGPPRVFLALQTGQLLVNPTLYRCRRDKQLVRAMVIVCRKLRFGDRRDRTCRFDSGDFREYSGFDEGVRGEN